jgi:predicted nucleic acid-binding protein
MESAVLGLVLDSSVIIEAERKRQTVEELLTAIRHSFGEVEITISAITVQSLCMASLGLTRTRFVTAAEPLSTNLRNTFRCIL